MLKQILRLLLVSLVLTTTIISGAQNAPPSPQTAPGPNETVTDRWAVILSPGTDAPGLARALRFELLGPVGYLPNTYTVRRPGSERGGIYAQAAAQALASSPAVVFFQQQVERQHFPLDPTDEPGFTSQWHLNNTGQSGGTAGEDSNILAAWNAGYTGLGAQVAIVDSGVEYTQPDMANYTATGSYDFWDNDPDPMPTGANEAHGHSAAGVAAAADDGTCGAGAAYQAALASIRTDLNFDDAGGATILSYQRNANDIYNNSWGWGYGDTLGKDVEPLLFAALEDNVINGRGGLGNIYLFAAGNDGGGGPGSGENTNRLGYNSSRYTISVAASDNFGVRSSYSEFGTAVHVNAPSNGGTAGIYTSDLSGAAGYSNSDCTTDFGGTSSASPLVAGIVALMLDANPNLTWRDVQYVLAESAEKNDSTDPNWFTNEAGYDVSIYYGFGRADGGAAAALAATWATVPDEFSVASGTQTANLAIPDNNPGGVSDTVNVTQAMALEHVEIHINTDHPNPEDLAIHLTAPSGTVSEMMTRRDVSNHLYDDLTLMSVHHWGESSVGTWTLEVFDERATNSGTLVDWELILYGVPVLPNDDVSTPTAITSLTYTQTVNTTGTTSDSSTMTPSCGLGHYRSAWYTFTPSQTGAYNLSTEGSSYDTVLSVWDGNSEIGCNNDTGSNVTSDLVQDLTAGTPYTIMVNGYDGAHGQLVFTVDQGPNSLSPNGDTLTTAPVLPTFTWNGPTDTIEYRVFVWNTNKVTMMDETFTAADICTAGACAITDSEYTDIARWGLLNLDYEWWVGGHLPDGTWQWSPMATFTVDVPPPLLPDPISVDPGDGRIAISWPDDPNTLWVQIWVGVHPNGSYFQWHERDGADRSFTCDGATCVAYPVWDVVTASGLSVWMQAWGPGGFSSGGPITTATAWNHLDDVNGTPGDTFNLPQAAPLVPTNIAPSGTVATIPTSLSWTGAPGSTWYNVILYTPSTNDVPYNNWHQASTVACDGALANPDDYDCVLDGLSLQLTTNTDHDIYMRVWGPGGFSTGGLTGLEQWTKGTFTYAP